MLYRYKVAIFAGILAAFTAFLVYITGPKANTVPTLRVLHISYSDYATIKRVLFASSFTADESVQVFKISEDGTVTVGRTEWELKSTPEGFYQNNLVLECTASFPVTWKYSGYGEPSVTEENVVIYKNFNDSSTFSYLSLLNLMPAKEKSTGKYICYGASNDTAQFAVSVHLFIPGETVFLVDYDVTIEAPGEDKIFVPCPVTNASANISLYFKNQALSSDKSMAIFDPKSGFYLKPRFVEEQSDPWGEFYCENEETKEKSGVITIQPTKGLIVNAIPDSNTIVLSKPSKTSNKLEEKFKLICQAKEEVILKFQRVAIAPTVQYDYNASSSFPFSAYAEVSSKNFRNLSRIYCRPKRNNDELHSWKVLFSSSGTAYFHVAMRSELLEFNYDIASEEFACCSPSNKRAKVTLLPCSSVSECRIKGQCLLPGGKCTSANIVNLPERAGCVRYKIAQENEMMNGGSGTSGVVTFGNKMEDDTGYSISVESGLLQCTVDGKSVERVFFSVKKETENGTTSEILSELLENNELDVAPVFTSGLNFSQNHFQLMEILEISSAVTNQRRFVCRGPKFFLGIGFLWQTILYNGDIMFHAGRDSIKGPWAQSYFRTTSSSLKVKSLNKLYCLAPLWNLNGQASGWLHAKLEWS